MKQKTIKNKVSFSGIALHSGVVVNIRLLPSEDGGIVFKRIDKKENNLISALYYNVCDTRLGTVITNGYEKVSTIEHLMAAFWACDIDNIIVEIDNIEVPILDGSSVDFINQIKKAGIIELKKNRIYKKFDNEFIYEENDKFIKYIPSNDFSIEMTVEFKYGSIGKQEYIFNGDQESFINNLSIARTFCHEKEIEFMRANNLAKGGSLDNAMVFGDEKIINESGFRVENEVVKHKILDCIGDLFTCGYFLKGKIVAYKTGHDLNNKFLKNLFK